MAGRVFEIPVEKFMDEFIPGPNLTSSKRERGKWKSKFRDLELITKESQMYPGFCAAVNLVLGKVEGNRLVARDTADWGDKTENGAKLMGLGSVARPSVSIYPNPPDAVRDYELTAVDVEGSKCAKARHRHLARVCWQRLCIPIELKTDHTLSAFEFLKPEKESPVRSEKAMGRVADCASKILLAQHREFCLVVYVFKSLVRLVRWDRVGAIVSEPFNYVTGGTLQTFIYRVGHMSDAELGYDPTVVAAMPAEIQLMENCRGRLNDHHKQCLDEAMSPKWPIYKVAFYVKDLVDSEALRKDARSAGQSVPTSNSTPHASLDDGTTLPIDASNPSLHSDDTSISEPVRYFLIGRPRFAAHSPTGRATRGYVAYDMETERLAFLKDTWRPDSSKIHPEREVYERLYKHDVSHIATLLCGGDVGPTSDEPQRTCTQEFDESKSLLGRIHYRVVVKEVGRPLDDHENSREMLYVIFDALTAHREAWERAEVLHRDISIGNILIDEDPDNPGYHGAVPKVIKGFLNDWDLCKYKDELDSEPTQKSRSGTWQFMSALLLQFPRKRYEVSDDLESFMHVVNWLALKWYRHRLRAGITLQQHTADTYDHWARVDGYDLGGHEKLQQIRIGEVPFILSVKGGLSSLLEKLMELCHEHYKTIDMVALKLGRAESEEPEEDLPELLDETFAIHPAQLRRMVAVLAGPETGRDPARDFHTTQVPRPTLSSHSLIMDAFAEVLSGERHQWRQDKVENRSLGAT
ncbi:predicted protein [Sparassis crispa]|uniref:Protein kinase domain-containing protein n=1 Tax=Sparassis crispa TaxID=139825 RepID=A0A401GYV4_9APHY|nr:predicted protein [Sparassis crispa]GBE87345.1 predicted protein [Sparassis crispa]